MLNMPSPCHTPHPIYTIGNTRSMREISIVLTLCVFSTGGSPPYIPDANTPANYNEPYLDWLNYILNQTSIPQTISTSYGDDEQTVPFDYAVSVCNAFAQLGARGSSVLFSSGDSGVGGPKCTSNDGTNRTEFLPNFPASCKLSCQPRKIQF
jgi:tripeptidyl-peptidase I